jgi:uncharacterized protein (TIGR00255 family)
MPVYSMTGFASVQNEATPPNTTDAHATPPRGNCLLSLEIRSVNSRFLDLSFRLPDELRQAEPALRELLTRSIRRGKVEVRAAYAMQTGTGLTEPAPDLLNRLAGLQALIRNTLPDAPPIGVADVIRMCSTSALPGPETGQQLVELAPGAIDALLASRAREGQRLAHMLQDRLTQLTGLAEKAEPLIPELVNQQRTRFLQRWNEAIQATDGSVSAQAGVERALTEATAFAIRIDVAEELTRLRSHVSEIGDLLRKGGDIGKRLDFLIQELHREANTLGSKSATLELTRISVDMKVLIEQMREQVQNIE